MNKSNKHLLAIIALGLLLTPRLADAAGAIKIGKLSPVVDKLYYETQTLKGYTVNGKFKYRVGETVTFSYMGYVLGMPAGAPVTTILNPDDSEVSANKMRWLQALDAKPLKAGTQLALKGGKIAKTELDFLDADALQSALSAILPGATLPPADPSAATAQLAATNAALATVITKYKASTFVSYDVEDYYPGRIFPGYQVAAPGRVVSATVTFNAPFKVSHVTLSPLPNIPFSGNVSLVMADGSTPSFTVTEGKGQTVINGTPLYYWFFNNWHAPQNGRTLSLFLHDAENVTHGFYRQMIELRNTALKNLPAHTSYITGMGWGGTVTPYTLKYEAAPALVRRKDPDGNVADQDIVWEVMNGDEVIMTGAGRTFSFDRSRGQKLTVVLTVTDDEGLASVRKSVFGQFLTLKEAIELVTGKLWLEQSYTPSEIDYYYKLGKDLQDILEYEVRSEDGAVVYSGPSGVSVSVSSMRNVLKYVSMPSPYEFLYEGPDPENPEEKTTIRYRQTEPILVGSPDPE